MEIWFPCYVVSGIVSLVVFAGFLSPVLLSGRRRPSREFVIHVDDLGLPQSEYRATALQSFGRWSVWVTSMPASAHLPPGLLCTRKGLRLDGTFPDLTSAQAAAQQWADCTQQWLAKGDA